MKQKKEAGYTLILVLLTITLIFIFSLTLISNILNSSAQNKKTEEMVQEKNLSDMAITYFNTSILSEIDGVQDINTLITKLDGYNPPDFQITADKQRNVTIKIDKITPVSSDPNSITLSLVITIEGYSEPMNEDIVLTLKDN